MNRYFTIALIIILLILVWYFVFKSPAQCIRKNSSKQQGQMCMTCDPQPKEGIIFNGKCFGFPNEFWSRHTIVYKDGDNYTYASISGGPRDKETKESYIRSYKSYLKSLPKEITQVK